MITREKIISRMFENHVSMSSFTSHIRENEYLYCSRCGERKDRFNIENNHTVECNSCGTNLSIEYLLKHDNENRNKDTIIGYLKSRIFDHDESDFKDAYRGAERELKREVERQEQQLRRVREKE